MRARLSFVKMQATGNDFVMVDARKLLLKWKQLSQRVCRAHFGVGADGLILVQDSKNADLKMRIFNADGSEAQICGNGLRCFAKYAIERGLVDGRTLTVETLAGVKTLTASAVRGKVVRASVNMGRPVLQPERVPVSVKGQAPVLNYPVAVAGRRLALSFVSMGNPHAVCFIDEPVDSFPLDVIGPLVEHHALFPERTNFEIVNAGSVDQLKVRVWERGVGETLACGSGACATGVMAQLQGRCGRKTDIVLPGGTLTIEWDGSGDVIMTGPAEEVFSGEYEL